MPASDGAPPRGDGGRPRPSSKATGAMTVAAVARTRDCTSFLNPPCPEDAAVLPPRSCRHTTRRAPWFVRAMVALGVGALALLVPVGSAPAQTLSLQMASKNFPGAQVLSQVYGQALATRGAHVTFSDAVGAPEV